MENTLAGEASVSADGRSISFITVVAGRSVRCPIRREALERYFWVPLGASDHRLMKAFNDGRERVFAVAERKWRARQSEIVHLGVSDFLR